jgi:hypothetical protein
MTLVFIETIAGGHPERVTKSMTQLCDMLAHLHINKRVKGGGNPEDLIDFRGEFLRVLGGF